MIASRVRHVDSLDRLAGQIGARGFNTTRKDALACCDPAFLKGRSATTKKSSSTAEGCIGENFSHRHFCESPFDIEVIDRTGDADSDKGANQATDSATSYDTSRPSKHTNSSTDSTAKIARARRQCPLGLFTVARERLDTSCGMADDWDLLTEASHSAVLREGVCNVIKEPYSKRF